MQNSSRNLSRPKLALRYLSSAATTALGSPARKLALRYLSPALTAALGSLAQLLCGGHATYRAVKSLPETPFRQSTRLHYTARHHIAYHLSRSSPDWPRLHEAYQLLVPFAAGSSKCWVWGQLGSLSLVSCSHKKIDLETNFYWWWLRLIGRVTTLLKTIIGTRRTKKPVGLLLLPSLLLRHQLLTSLWIKGRAHWYELL